MSTTPNDPDPADGAEASRTYEALKLEDGELVIYDPSDHRAWIQCDAPVALAECA